jgi:hypothetical protein
MLLNGIENLAIAVFVDRPVCVEARGEKRGAPLELDRARRA